MFDSITHVNTRICVLVIAVKCILFKVEHVCYRNGICMQHFSFLFFMYSLEWCPLTLMNWQWTPPKIKIKEGSKGGGFLCVIPKNEDYVTRRYGLALHNLWMTQDNAPKNLKVGCRGVEQLGGLVLGSSW